MSYQKNPHFFKTNIFIYAIYIALNLHLLITLLLIWSQPSWTKFRTVSFAYIYLVANQVELALLTCYPLPSKVIMDMGKEVLGEFTEMITNDYGIRLRSVTSRNPKANVI